MAVCWKDKREVMHIPPAEGDFKEGGKAVKPLIIWHTLTWVIGWRTATALEKRNLEMDGKLVSIC
jgi:hypothetical protein